MLSKETAEAAYENNIIANSMDRYQNLECDEGDSIHDAEPPE